MDERLLQCAETVLGSLRVWFPPETALSLPGERECEWIRAFTAAVSAIARECRQGPVMLSECRSDAVDCLNRLEPFLRGYPLSKWHERVLLESLIQKQLLRMPPNQIEWTDDPSYWLIHASRIMDSVQLLTDWAAFQTEENQIRLHPRLRFPEKSTTVFTDDVTPEKLAEAVISNDPFRLGRAFRYINGGFVPVILDSIRPLNSFFGFESLRKLIGDFFDEFSAGEPNVPLVMTGLPGIGKTHLTLANILSRPDLTLILGDPEGLEKPFEGLIGKLAARPYRKFILFFDDIDPRQTQWHTFRTHIGGSFILPPNIALIIASNYPFPANILSRARGCTFPLFDAERCREMILDFLKSIGMKKPPENLAEVIAADYLEACGQKRYEDISPRTLMRHLESFARDPSKRMRLLESANSDVYARPDPDLFFDANIKRLRALHGELAIDELRHQMMKEYGLS